MRDERRGRPAAVRATVLACALCAAAGFIAYGRAAAPQATRYQMPASAAIDPSGVDFGDQVIGRWSRAQRVVVTNTGGAPLHVHSAHLEGDAPGQYSISKDTCTGAEVVPYRGCVIDITFLPAGKDDFDAELKLVSDAPESPQSIHVTGEGINSAMMPPGL